MNGAIGRVLVLVGCVLLAATATWAQQLGGIAGVARDTSGAVLPGVSVEAASPVLIEKARNVVTDAEGQYKIVDLRPGTYTVTFSLQGFATVKREGVELTGGFTATVNAELRVGSLEETVTVSGASPLVDTQNVVAQKVVSAELFSALPSSTKALVTLVNIVPGMTGTADVGGASGIYTSNATYKNSFHGKGGVKFLYDGMNALNMNAGATSYIVNSATVEESTVQTSGATADSTASGVLINLIPKEGSNAFKGSVNGFYTNDRLQSDNLDASLNARGLTTTNKVLGLYDANFTLGGPIRKDKLWFFLAPRAAGNREQVPGIYFNKTLGSPLYTPDVSRPAYRQERLWGQAERLTWQVSAGNKISVFADTQGLFILGRGEFTAPESGTAYNFWPDGLYQITWNSPRTDKLLLEAGASMMRGPYPYPSPGSGFMQVSPTNVATTDLTTGFIYNARPSYSTQWDNTRIVQRFSASYVTGSHAVKAGVQVEEGISNQATQIQGNVTYQFLASVPNRITEFATPYLQKERMMPDLGLFAQDQWTLKRLTLNYGLRFSWFYGYVPEQSVPAGQFVGARSFGRVTAVPNWKDVNPRLGASYDLFGNGRTAVKFAVGRYNNVTATTFQRNNNPITTSVNSVTRTWNDSNGNYLPDCDLKNPVANGECGQISDLNFGGRNVTTQYADDVRQGWGVRNYLWDISAEVQHQLTPRISVTGGYYGNWAGNFSVTNNLSVTPADYSPFCITAPVDPRLPGGGGYQVCGLYDISPTKFGITNNLVTQASNFYGKSSSANCAIQPTPGVTGTGDACGQSNFFDVSLNTRLRPGIQLGGGVDTGRTVIDNCFVVNTPQQLLNCHVVTPFKAQTQIKVFGSYPLPAGLQVSGTFQNTPGPPIAANYTATNAQIAPSLGRNLGQCRGVAVCTGSVSLIPLIPPMTRFEARRTQLDLRLSKVFRFGAKTRLQANLDAYNALNGNAILGVNSTYGARWLLPIAVSTATEPVLQGRLIQLGGELTF